jgi:hypothetical protein
MKSTIAMEGSHSELKTFKLAETIAKKLKKKHYRKQYEFRSIEFANNAIPLLCIGIVIVSKFENPGTIQEAKNTNNMSSKSINNGVLLIP